MMELWKLRCKSKLVVRDFTQKERINYTKTFSLVVKMTTMRSIVVISVNKGWKIVQLDVNNAFLHVNSHEEIYMKAPPSLAV